MRYAGKFLLYFFYLYLIYGIKFWGHVGIVQKNKILILQKKVLEIILKLQITGSASDSFR